MEQFCNVKCPLCGHVNVVQIKETQWPHSFHCEKCHNTFLGHQNPHGWPWIFCTYGDVPWFNVQRKQQDHQ